MVYNAMADRANVLYGGLSGEHVPDLTMLEVSSMFDE